MEGQCGTGGTRPSYCGGERSLREYVDSLLCAELRDLVRRYGRSAFTVRSLVQKTVASFVRIYSADFVTQGAFASIGNFSAATELNNAASLVASDFFSQAGVSDLFTNELTSAATQVNYGAPVTRLHGVGALVSLAATGAVSVRGGNRQIFEHFVGRSGARLRLGENARVEEVLKLDSPGTESRARWVVKTASGVGGGTYDVRPAANRVSI